MLGLNTRNIFMSLGVLHNLIFFAFLQHGYLDVLTYNGQGQIEPLSWLDRILQIIGAVYVAKMQRQPELLNT